MFTKERDEHSYAQSSKVNHIKKFTMISSRSDLASSWSHVFIVITLSGVLY